jgi:transposase
LGSTDPSEFDQTWSMGGDDHDCAWKAHAVRLSGELEQVNGELEQLKAEMAALKRHVYGKRSDKMPPMDREVKRGGVKDPEASKAARQKNAELKAKSVVQETVDVPVPAEERHCPKCGGDNLTPLESAKPSSVTEYVPGYFRKRTYRREKLLCACGKHIITATVPDKVFEKTQYGPGFMAYLAVSKTLDCMPLYRLEKSFKRIGIPISRSTMNTLFHRVGNALGLIARRILALVAAADIVLADETTLKTQVDADKKHYIWTFIAGNNIAYRFSAGRGGQTPREVLGGTQGTLVVDAYTGYNSVTAVEGRERAACLAHVRRKFFDALSSAPEAKQPLEIIRQVYIIEHRAREHGIAGSDEHTQWRQRESRPILEQLQAWIAKNEGKHIPKSPLGMAMAHAKKNWTELTRFLDDARIPPDNNASERALRVVALGRKNFLFVHDIASGESLANLYTVLATCEANEVNPQAYLTDILMRLDSTPVEQLDSLLPQNWRPQIVADG